MFAIDLVIALLVGVLLAGALVWALGWRYPGYPSPWPTAILLTVLIFLAAWAGGLWLIPTIGPILWGGYWLFLVVAGLVVSYFLFSRIPTGAAGGSFQEVTAQASARQTSTAALAVFYWLLISAMITAIILHYLIQGRS